MMAGIESTPVSMPSAAAGDLPDPNALAAFVSGTAPLPSPVADSVTSPTGLAMVSVRTS